MLPGYIRNLIELGGGIHNKIAEVVKLFFRTRIVYAGGPFDMLNGRAREKAPPLDVPFTDEEGPPTKENSNSSIINILSKLLLLFSYYKTRSDMLQEIRI